MTRDGWWHRQDRERALGPPHTTTFVHGRHRASASRGKPRLLMTGEMEGDHDMSEAEVFEELRAWHERYLVDDENWERFLSAHKALALQELGNRLGAERLIDGERPVGAERSAVLARCGAARDQLTLALKGVKTGVLCDEADDLLARAVDAGLVTYRLGTPGEVAVARVREIRAGRRPKFRADHALAALVESGRLVAPTAARCVKCHVMRPMADLDAFTSPASWETIYACHGEQRPPEDRLGLDPWDDLLDSWGEPCSVWDQPRTDL